jgi:gamma-glutamylcyclotransferase (GGCT)/AIG2-like uncharacterized protein YtfP
MHSESCSLSTGFVSFRMVDSNVYAFYGSLRRGLANYEKFKPHLKYLNSMWLNGFQLYSLGDFPFAYRTHQSTDLILVEIFQITDLQTQKKIDELEFNYGYHIEQVMLEEQPVNIYLFRDRANYPLVSGGDWVKFFRG